MLALLRTDIYRTTIPIGWLNLPESVTLSIKQHQVEDIKNKEGFERLFRTYYQVLCNYVFTYLKESAASEEVVQELFFKLWQKRDQIEVNGAWKSYLFRAARNESLNILKHLDIRDKYKEINLEQRRLQENTPGDQLESQEINDRVARAINQLPEQRQLIFRMSRFEDKRYREIAQELGISIKTVENQMSKALTYLRNELSDLLPALLIILESLFIK